MGIKHRTNSSLNKFRTLNKLCLSEQTATPQFVSDYILITPTP